MFSPRKVLLTGCGGQVGAALAQHAPDWADIVACDRGALDLRNNTSIRQAVREIAPAIIINAAAYTAVDQAETDRAAAFQINAEAVRILAEEAARQSAKLVHFSTDYVFDGSASYPYQPTSAKNPQSVYGQSKSRGEDQLANTLAEEKYLLLRTAWVYAPGGKNFVSTMLHLMLSKAKLRVIADQIGSPTSALNLAKSTWTAIEREVQGVHHCTDAGVASWYDFACAIARLALDHGVIAALPEITPITTADYPQAAKRPAFGVLDKHSFWAASGVVPDHWTEALRRNWDWNAP